MALISSCSNYWLYCVLSFAWAPDHCRISPPRFVAECCKKWQGSFLLLCFALFAFSGLCLVFVMFAVFNSSSVMYFQAWTKMNSTVQCADVPLRVYSLTHFCRASFYHWLNSVVPSAAEHIVMLDQSASLISSCCISSCCTLVNARDTFVCNLQNDPENDRMISDHILCMHRYRSPGEQDGEGVFMFLCKY